MGSPVFGNRGDCIGIMSKLPGYILQDGKRTFIITIVYPPYNYDFVNVAKVRSNDEINHDSEQQSNDTQPDINQPLQFYTWL